MLTKRLQLQKRGLITDEERAQINEVAQIYYDVYQTAVDALEAYVKVDSGENKDRVSQALLETQTALARLLARVEPYLVKLE